MRKTFRQTFPENGKVFLPVIHINQDLDQTLINTAIASCAEADGIFLIDHQADTMRLQLHYSKVRSIYPNLWIGLNFLGQTADRAFRLCDSHVNGVWADEHFINETTITQAAAERISRARLLGDSDAIFFGSIGFKYQPLIGDLAQACRLALPYVDVLTTSGPATGQAPDVSKMALIRETVGQNFPVALASGVMPENVKSFLPFTDCFLVATGISKNFHELDPIKTIELSRLIHAG